MLYTRLAVCIAKCSQLWHGRPCDNWLHLAIHTAGRQMATLYATKTTDQTKLN